MGRLQGATQTFCPSTTLRYVLETLDDTVELPGRQKTNQERKD